MRVPQTHCATSSHRAFATMCALSLAPQLCTWPLLSPVQTQQQHRSPWSPSPRLPPPLLRVATWARLLSSLHPPHPGTPPQSGVTCFLACHHCWRVSQHGDPQIWKRSPEAGHHLHTPPTPQLHVAPLHRHGHILPSPREKLRRGGGGRESSLQVLPLGTCRNIPDGQFSSCPRCGEAAHFSHSR